MLPGLVPRTGRGAERLFDDYKKTLEGGQLTKEQVEQELAGGEGKDREFKATLRWNLHAEQNDPQISASKISRSALQLTTSKVGGAVTGAGTAVAEVSRSLAEMMHFKKKPDDDFGETPQQSLSQRRSSMLDHPIVAAALQPGPGGACARLTEIAGRARWGGVPAGTPAG